MKRKIQQAQNKRLWARADRYGSKRTYLRVNDENPAETIARYASMGWRAGYEAALKDARRRA